MLFALMIVLLLACGVFAFYYPVWWFIAGTAVGIALLLSGIATEQLELVLTGPAIIILVLVALIFKKFRLFAIRILISCGLMVLVIGGFVVFGRGGGSVGLIVFMMFTGALIGVMSTSELTTAAYVISTIGSAMRQNLPLPMALEMASQGLTGKRARILRAIKKWLVEGYSLSESLKRGYPKCPGFAVALITAGEQIGQVPQAIEAIEQDIVAKLYQSRKVRHSPMFYPPILLLFMFVIVLFLFTFVLPRFVQVLGEMSGGVKLPFATAILFKIIRFVTHDYGWVIALVLLALLVIYIPFYIGVRVRRRRPERPYLTSRIGDFIKWHLPFVRWYEWNRSMQQVAGMLRLSLNAGCTVNKAIANTLGLDVNECFRKKLRQWLVMVERGDDIGLAAQNCGMGSAMTWAFADISNHRNTIGILESLESAYRWGYNRAAALTRFIIGPCETICLGLMVGFIVYAVFAPIVAIIFALTPTVVP
jgi:type IV pilus assembly protein PilC